MKKYEFGFEVEVIVKFFVVALEVLFVALEDFGLG